MKQADVRAWFAGRGWKPFKFQREVWKAIAGGRSGLLRATTGAGKTYAVWLGALMSFSAFAQVPRTRRAIKNIAKNENENESQKTEPLTVLWITPMRALAADTLRALREPLEAMNAAAADMLPQVIAEIENSGTTLVFTNTRSQAEIWYQAMLEAQPDWAGTIALHHGSLDRAVREWVELSLKKGDLKAVVCTSSLDLGVDFLPVERVLQIGSAKGVARLLQRAGRSGHAPGRPPHEHRHHCERRQHGGAICRRRKNRHC